ncbi:NECAP-like protein CG9132 [Anthonomus grandis grandis]|uniref:NECAP-like protein CG9132 n=1 Tax=Anthonomus grandis grandis TaxID=2921223 RepID=UPI002165BDD3|nr:NECAP-like protein CG9132 [Anthonomus grandis grandis]
METYESVLLVKPEVYVFNIPPRYTNRGYRAADWNLAEPQWTGRMRLISKGNELAIKLEDKNSGELFAKCPIETYPGTAIEPVTDSSRYFVLRIQDDSNGRSAYIGLGFGDRSDSFDLNVALQDHFKWLKKEKQISEEPSGGPSLDLGFKEGETIKINMKITKKDGSEANSKSKTKTGGVGLGLLPPPPGGKLPAPPGSSPASSPAHAPKQGNNSGGESWGEFASAPSAAPAQPSPNSNWVQF